MVAVAWLQARPGPESGMFKMNPCLRLPVRCMQTGGDEGKRGKSWFHSVQYAVLLPYRLGDLACLDFQVDAFLFL